MSSLHDSMGDEEFFRLRGPVRRADGTEIFPLTPEQHFKLLRKVEEERYESGRYWGRIRGWVEMGIIALVIILHLTWWKH